MEKRVIIFLVLSLAIIFGYDFLLKEFGFTPFSPLPYLDQPESLSEPHPQETTHPESSSTPETSVQPAQRSDPNKTVNGHKQSIEIDTPLYHATLTNQGGQLTKWELKNYLDPSQEGNLPLDLVYSDGHFPGPLTVRVPDPAITDLLQNAFYDVHQQGSILDERHQTNQVILTYSNAENGIEIKKSLTFHYDSYVVDIVISSQGLHQGLDVLLGTNFGIVDWGKRLIGFLGPAWMFGDTIEKETPETEMRRTGDLRWAALQDKYFMSVLIPKGAESLFVKTETERVASLGIGFPPEKGHQTYSLQLYAGPKQFDILKSFNIGLEDTIDFGWFVYGSWAIVKAVAKPLFYILRFLHDYTHNYGLSIILLTCGVKLLFVPLQYKSYKSMQGMKEIQPKVAVIQTKYKEDRERLNKELMKLYREHKVNPVGGCLPMVLQMPVFVALFNILYMTIDLRQAPFILWITDLSAQDPFYILPILMGVSMVVQQKIMPTTMDPTQAKMMLLLPVFLTFLFVTFPAGLVLYWLTNNVLTITQQFVTDRYIFKRVGAPSPQKEGITNTVVGEPKERGKNKSSAGEKSRKESRKH